MQGLGQNLYADLSVEENLDFLLACAWYRPMSPPRARTNCWK
ncbi:MAG: hypothetical protein U1E47_02450 [Rivihabitans pingtungensis]